jgi:nitrogen fixation NifU-like protein
MIFSPTLLDHFERPRNSGSMEGADAEAEVENPVCGDRLHVWLRIRDGVIEEMRWHASGCAPALAAASVLSEMVRGMDIQAALRLDREAIAGALGGLPARKMHAASLAVSALRTALAFLVHQESPP